MEAMHWKCEANLLLQKQTEMTSGPSIRCQLFVAVAITISITFWESPEKAEEAIMTKKT